MSGDSVNMEDWIKKLRNQVILDAPDLIDLFNLYASEALFGRSYIAKSLSNLNHDAQILEVGAGSLILSSQLAREGFNITALEPTGDGFGHFNVLRKIVTKTSIQNSCMPKMLEISAEELEIKGEYNFAFSVNVMEHVKDVNQTLKKVVQSLKSGGEYKFTCPNYIFPYEPHFNIPTVISKGITEKVFFNSIYKNPKILDPSGLWQSLNWINVLNLKRFANKEYGIVLQLRKELFNEMIDRAINDPEFSKRRSPLIKKILNTVVNLRLNLVAKYIPAIFQPVIDCSLIKP